MGCDELKAISGPSVWPTWVLWTAGTGLGTPWAGKHLILAGCAAVPLSTEGKWTSDLCPFASPTQGSGKEKVGFEGPYWALQVNSFALFIWFLNSWIIGSFKTSRSKEKVTVWFVCFIHRSYVMWHVLPRELDWQSSMKDNVHISAACRLCGWKCMWVKIWMIIQQVMSIYRDMCILGINEFEGMIFDIIGIVGL